MKLESVITDFEKKLGENDFIEPADLIKAGIFGSNTSVRNFLRAGSIPSLKISPHRVIIAKADVIAHLRKGLRPAIQAAA